MGGGGGGCELNMILFNITLQAFTDALIQSDV